MSAAAPKRPTILVKLAVPTGASLEANRELRHLADRIMAMFASMSLKCELVESFASDELTITVRP